MNKLLMGRLEEAEAAAKAAVEAQEAQVCAYCVGGCLVVMLAGGWSDEPLTPSIHEGG